jgi:hypothetical protein
MPNQRELSSRSTRTYRILPYVFAPVFGLMFWDVATRTGHSAGDRLGFLILYLSFLFVIFYARRPMRVILEGENLLISDLRKEIKVPLSSVSEVRQGWFEKGSPITLTLRAPTIFGDKIKFFPEERWFCAPWKPHPITAELRELIKSRTIGA